KGASGAVAATRRTVSSRAGAAAVLELLAQFAAARFRQILEALEAVTQVALLVGRQSAEALETVAQPGALFRRTGVPLAQLLAGAFALGGIERLPAVGAAPQAFLALRRQAVPAILQGLQELLLLAVQVVPVNALRARRRGQEQQEHAGQEASGTDGKASHRNVTRRESRILNRRAVFRQPLVELEILIQLQFARAEHFQILHGHHRLGGVRRRGPFRGGIQHYHG